MDFMLSYQWNFWFLLFFNDTIICQTFSSLSFHVLYTSSSMAFLFLECLGLIAEICGPSTSTNIGLFWSLWYLRKALREYRTIGLAIQPLPKIFSGLWIIIVNASYVFLTFFSWQFFMFLCERSNVVGWNGGVRRHASFFFHPSYSECSFAIWKHVFLQIIRSIISCHRRCFHILTPTTAKGVWKRGVLHHGYAWGNVGRVVDQ